MRRKMCFLRRDEERELLNSEKNDVLLLFVTAAAFKLVEPHAAASVGALSLSLSGSVGVDHIFGSCLIIFFFFPTGQFRARSKIFYL